MSEPKHAIVCAIDTAVDDLANVDDFAELSEYDLCAVIGLALEMLEIAQYEIALREQAFAITVRPRKTAEPE